jgi:prepilin signal peptidase PulO-like enzyme (type II secretory pathway)
VLPTFLLVLGLIFGSFFNVCIYRISKNISLNNNSSCINCKKEIKFYHNIPIISFIILKGKCSNCKTKISFSYPIVELITGLVFLTSFKVYGISYEFIFFIIFYSSLLIIFFTDLKEFLILDKISLPVGYMGLTISLVSLNPFNINFTESAIGSLIGYLIIFLIRLIYLKLRKVEGMGLGDAKLFFLVGAWLGYKSIFYILIFSSLLGSIVGLIIIIKYKKNIKYQLPYGCFIVLTTYSYQLLSPYFFNLI